MNHQRFTAWGFQGAGVVRGEVVRDAFELNAMLSRVEHADQLIDLISESSGAFTAQLHDNATRDLYLLADPLGGGLLLRYRSQNTDSYGVDINSMRVALKHCGVQLVRDATFELSRLATGTACYGSDTPFQRVEALPPGVGVIVSEKGRVQEVSYGLSRLRSITSDLSYDELVDAGKEDILENVRAAVASSELDIYADITGGFDSRLVLAGLTAIGAQDAVTLTSISSSPEWPYARSLAASTGFAITSQRFMGGAPQAPSTLMEYTFRGSRSSGSIIDNGMDPLTPQSSIATLQGGYGETFRTFSNFNFRPSSHGSLEGLTDGIWAWTRLQKAEIAGQRLFSDALFTALTARFDRFASRGILEGVAPDYLTNYSYLASRNRYWIGQQSYWRSQIQTRLDPLYSQHLILAAERLPFHERRANFVGLDLMSRLCPKLLSYPFYNRNVVTGSWISKRGDVEYTAFDSSTPTEKHVAGAERSGMQRFGENSPYTPEDNIHAKRLGVQASHVADVLKWSPRALATISDRDDLVRYFNPEPLRALLSQVPTTTTHFDLARKLLGSMLRSGLLTSDYSSADDAFMFGI